MDIIISTLQKSYFIELKSKLKGYIDIEVMDYSYLKTLKEYKGFKFFKGQKVGSNSEVFFVKRNFYSITNIVFINKMVSKLERKFPEITELAFYCTKDYIGIDNVALLDLMDFDSYLDKWIKHLNKKEMLKWVNNYYGTTGKIPDKVENDFLYFILEKYFKFPFKKTDKFITYFDFVYKSLAKKGK